ncbi:MAG: 2-C-methyl-D-erythritol 2,4-cyclodiphosphate synthase [Elusimicrobia bacterium RIFCSPLOWO2_01_FULL_60_11]|nr:MAG: 2-C-methyl-D-erythritol 2,4-cyclodiphosphate synthase [Elusimicrobia bacterium RIFCSPLOWO2_01_FULL_60_11]
MGNDYRTGIGYDAHRLVKGRPLFLGGVRIPHSHGLLGHSDADVILHAVVDALLGAAGLADIGTHFSNKDPRWKNAPSVIFLKETARMVSKKKMKIVNLDCVLLSEAPKISPYIPRMKAVIATALGIPADAVGVKASTNEGMGFVGKKQGMAATAVALVRA